MTTGVALMSAPVISIGEPTTTPTLSGLTRHWLTKSGEYVDSAPPPADILRTDHVDDDGMIQYSQFVIKSPEHSDVVSDVQSTASWDALYFPHVFDPVASEPVTLTNGRDSSISLSPPIIPTMSCTVHLPSDSMGIVVADEDWYQANHRVTMLCMTNEGCYPMFVGLLQDPEILQRNTEWFMRVNAVGWSTRLALHSYYNDISILTPQDNATVTTALYSLLTSYAQVAHADDTVTATSIARISIGPDFIGFAGATGGAFSGVPLGFYWTSSESPWNLLIRLIATMGPPAACYENVDGWLHLWDGDPDTRPQAGVNVGSAEDDVLQPAISFTVKDHVADIANRAIIPVQLYGFVPNVPGNIVLRPLAENDLPGTTITPAMGQGQLVYDDELHEARNDPQYYPFRETQGLDDAGNDTRLDTQKPQEHVQFDQPLPVWSSDATIDPLQRVSVSSMTTIDLSGLTIEGASGTDDAFTGVTVEISGGAAHDHDDFIFPGYGNDSAGGPPFAMCNVSSNHRHIFNTSVGTQEPGFGQYFSIDGGATFYDVIYSPVSRNTAPGAYTPTGQYTFPEDPSQFFQFNHTHSITSIPPDGTDQILAGGAIQFGADTPYGVYDSDSNLLYSGTAVAGSVMANNTSTFFTVWFSSEDYLGIELELTDPGHNHDVALNVSGADDVEVTLDDFHVTVTPGSIAMYRNPDGTDLAPVQMMDGAGNMITAPPTAHQHGLIEPPPPEHVPTPVTADTIFNGGPKVPGTVNQWEPTLIWSNESEHLWHQAQTGSLPTFNGSRKYRISHGSPWVFEYITHVGTGKTLQRVNTRNQRYVYYGTDANEITSGSIVIALEKINGTDAELTVTGTGGLPLIAIFGRQLNQIGALQYWNDDDTIDTSASERRYGIQVYNYRGMPTIYPSTAQDYANWAVQYYQQGVKTATTMIYAQRTAECLDRVLRLRPLQYIPLFENGGYDIDPVGLEGTAIRSLEHRWVQGHHWCTVTVDQIPLLTASGEANPFWK